MWVLKFRTLKSKKDNAFKQRFSDPHTYYYLGHLKTCILIVL